GACEGPVEGAGFGAEAGDRCPPSDGRLEEDEQEDGEKRNRHTRLKATDDRAKAPAFWPGSDGERAIAPPVCPAQQGVDEATAVILEMRLVRVVGKRLETR